MRRARSTPLTPIFDPGKSKGGIDVGSTPGTAPAISAAAGGYFTGGFVSALVATVDKFAFVDDTRSTLGTGLSGARWQLAGMADVGVAGYFGGGFEGGGVSANVTTVDKFDSSDTRSTLGTGLSSARNNLAAMADSAVAGYFGGGITTVAVTTVDKFAFPGDTRSTLGTGLTAARSSLAGMADPAVAGYFGGGTTSSGQVQRFAFPADTRTTLGTPLASGGSVQDLAAIADTGVAGYFGGGSIGATRQSAVYKYAFPGETQTTLGTGLSAARSFLAAAGSAGVAGYFAGGLEGANVATVDKFAFSTDTRSTLGTGLSSARRALAGAAI